MKPWSDIPLPESLRELSLIEALEKLVREGNVPSRRTCLELFKQSARELRRRGAGYDDHK